MGKTIHEWEIAFESVGKQMWIDKKSDGEANTYWRIAISQSGIQEPELTMHKEKMQKAFWKGYKIGKKTINT